MSDPRKRLEVTDKYGVDKDTCLFFCVSRWNINNVGLHDHRPVPRCRRMERRHRPVVLEAVLAADHAEAHHVLFLVEDLEALGAVLGGEAGDDVDFPESPDVAVAEEEVAAAEEVFVRLRVVEAAHDGPDGGERRVDVFDHGGAALVGAQGVCVVERHRVRDLRAVAWGGCVAAHGGVSCVHSFKQNR
ncbi:hypothetical protein ACET3Z_027686 [Daucus carota]